MSYFINPKNIMSVKNEDRECLDLIISEELEKNEDKVLNRIIENKIIVNLINVHYRLQNDKVTEFRNRIEKNTSKKEGIALFKQITKTIFSPSYREGLIEEKNEQLNEVEKLLLKGATITGKLGTDLLICCIKGYLYETSALLIKAGVEIETKDNIMSPVLKFCIDNERITFLELLVGLGINLNKKAQTGLGVIELAERTNNKSLIELLYLNGARKVSNSKNNEESTNMIFEESTTSMNEIEDSNNITK